MLVVNYLYNLHVNYACKLRNLQTMYILSKLTKVDKK